MGHSSERGGDHSEADASGHRVELGAPSARPLMEREPGPDAGENSGGAAARDASLPGAAGPSILHSDPVEFQERSQQGGWAAWGYIDSSDGASNLQRGREAAPAVGQRLLRNIHARGLGSSLTLMLLVIAALGVGPGECSSLRSGRAEQQPHNVLLSVSKPAGRRRLLSEPSSPAPAANPQRCERDSLTCSVAPLIWLYASEDSGIPQHGLHSGFLTLAGNADRQYVSKWNGQFLSPLTSRVSRAAVPTRPSCRAVEPTCISAHPLPGALLAIPCFSITRSEGDFGGCWAVADGGTCAVAVQDGSARRWTRRPWRLGSHGGPTPSRRPSCPRCRMAWRSSMALTTISWGPFSAR